jgi:hypothetical protein
VVGSGPTELVDAIAAAGDADGMQPASCAAWTSRGVSPTTSTDRGSRARPWMTLPLRIATVVSAARSDESEP